MRTVETNKFNLDWIIDLVKVQEPDRTDIIEALADCKNGKWESQAYVYYINPKNANQPGADWQFQENIVLEHEKEGTIVIDFLKDGKVGEIEFVKYIK